MKKLSLIVLLAISVLVGCTKKEEVSAPNNSFTNAAKNADVLIVGSWQLTSVGTVYTTSTAATGTGCSSSNSTANHSPQTLWENTSLKENLSFKSSGDYLKSAVNDGVCTGTYKVSNATILSQTSCSAQEEKQVINAIDATTMVIEVDGRTMHKYQKQ